MNRGNVLCLCNIQCCLFIYLYNYKHLPCLFEWGCGFAHTNAVEARLIITFQQNESCIVVMPDPFKFRESNDIKGVVYKTRYQGWILIYKLLSREVV